MPNEIAVNTSFEFEALNQAVRYRGALVQEFAPFLKGDVMEVGAGIGQTTAELARLENIKKLFAIEPDAGLAATFRETLPGIPLTVGTVADFSAQSSLDGIVSVNVLEHIEDDAAEISRYRNLLSQRRGILCAFVPARPEIYAPLDKDFGHFRRYTKPQLQDRLERAGFRVMRVDYFNVAGYFGWWLTFCLLRKRRFDPASVRFFDRCIFPFVHAFESRVMRPPFGQSLLAVAEAK